MNKNLDREIRFILNNRTEFLRKNASTIFNSVSTPANSRIPSTTYYYKTTFSVSMILGGINKILQDGVMAESCKNILEKIQDDAAKILLSEKTPVWTWNYWRRISPEFTQLPYPDDLDDTSCALFGLLGYFRKKGLAEKEGEAMAHFVNLLNKQKLAKNGPYETWILNKSKRGSKWKDIDPAVQSNIANLLNQYGMTIGSLENIFEDGIRNDHFKSKYYPTEAAIIYFMSRHYNGKFLIRFGNKILDRLKGDLNDLNRNLLICALVNCTNNLTQREGSTETLEEWQAWAIAQLQKTRVSVLKKSTLAYPFCNDPKRNDTIYYNQSAFVTCVVEMEALSGVLTLLNRKHQQTLERLHLRSIKKKVTHLASAQIPFVREKISSICNKILSGKNQREVWLLPFWWNNNKGGEKIVDLSYANTLGWAAYRIYDDCLDSPNPRSVKDLPIANICIYEAFAIFISNSRRNSDFIKNVIQNMETAIVRESFNFKSDHWQEKSIAHSIGPIIISCTKKMSARKSSEILLFFKYYLTARQLADDIRDRAEDRQRGFKNLASGKSDAELVRRMRAITKKAEDSLNKIEKTITVSTEKISEMLHRPEKELDLMLRSHVVEKSFLKTLRKIGYSG